MRTVSEPAHRAQGQPQRMVSDPISTDARAVVSAHSPVAVPGRSPMDRVSTGAGEVARLPAMPACSYLVNRVPAEYRRNRRDLGQAGATIELRRATNVVRGAPLAHRYPRVGIDHTQAGAG